jgi:hypothetical protein
MVDSRQKGARAEAAAKGLLIKHTGLDWQRTPGSGALNAAHKLKGDLYVPDEKNKFCVEVKHYKDDHLTSKLITDKTPQIMKWWEQAVRQGVQTGRIPLLLFKFDRSKWFVAFTNFALGDTAGMPSWDYRWIRLHIPNGTNYFHMAKLEEWLSHEEIEWIL